MTLQISGKTAIVTGAANGIGLAIARHFVEEGANVMCADMDEARLVEELGDVANEDGAPIRFYAGDLRERLTQANLLSATIDAFERVDILINASRQILKSDPLSSDDNSLEIMIEQNLMTSYRMSQVIARRMIQQSKLDPENGPAGSIINLSSIAARRTRDDLLGYS
ncbi:MAG: SDR family oxidoreductase, partial [Paracoccaceae bacterium]|nr:SDR family oxidoreductase [Paracoccaceae bacterium]